MMPQKRLTLSFGTTTKVPPTPSIMAIHHSKKSGWRHGTCVQATSSGCASAAERTVRVPLNGLVLLNPCIAIAPMPADAHRTGIFRLGR